MILDWYWWTPEKEFFGEFFEIADQSEEGFDVLSRMNRGQRTERELAIITKYLSLKSKTQILDCPCGSGRHSIGLVQKGFEFNVVGIDINDYALSLAKDKIGNSNFDGQLSFIKMDMRNLEFKNNSYDYIINMHTSFGFFGDDDNENVVKEFYRILRPNGKLLIHLDFNNDRVINKSYFQTDQHLSRNCIINGEHRILQQKEDYDETNNRLLGEWTLFNGEIITKSYNWRIYDNEKELIPLFKNNGFSTVELFDPEKDIFNIDSRETVLVAIK